MGRTTKTKKRGGLKECRLKRDDDVGRGRKRGPGNLGNRPEDAHRHGHRHDSHIRTRSIPQINSPVRWDTSTGRKREKEGGERHRQVRWTDHRYYIGIRKDGIPGHNKGVTKGNMNSTQ